MIKRRIIWALLIVLAVLLYLFVNSNITLAIFLLTVLLPVISIMTAFFGRKKIGADIQIQNECIKGEAVTGKITVFNKSKFLPFAVAAALESTNTRTGETERTAFEFEVRPNQSEHKNFEMRAAHSGLVQLQLDAVKVADCFGLFSFQTECRSADGIIVLPKGFETDIIISSNSAAGEGGQYTKNNAGYEVSEIIGLKEYVPGDSVKNIHWKLSQKTGKLLVKELARPVIHQLLLYVDLTRDKTADSDGIDAEAEVFFSIANALLRQEIDFSVGWDGRTVKITRQSELDDAVRALLSGQMTEDDSLHIPFEDFAHTVLVALPSRTEAFQNTDRVSAVQYRADNFERILKIIKI